MQGFDSYNIGGSGPEERDTDVARVLHILLFALRSVRRRIGLALVIAFAMYLVIVGALFVMPRTYVVQTRTLTSGASVLPALASPTRLLDIRGKSARSGVVERIKSRAALREVVRVTNLADSWAKTRAPLGKAIDWVRHTIVGPMSAEDMEDTLVGMLDGRVIAFFEGETLVIDVFWHDPEDAKRIAEAVLDNFLENRRKSELAEVRETVNILKARVDASANALEEKTKAYEAIVRKKAKGEVKMETKTVAVRRSTEAEDPNAEAKRRELEKTLRKVQGAISKVRSQSEAAAQGAQAELDSISKFLGPEHPDVQAAKRRLRAAQEPPSELRALVAEAARIEEDLRELKGSGAASTVEYKTIKVPSTRSGEAGRTVDGIRINEDPDVESANQDFLQAFRRHEELGNRLEEAETELEVSAAAFRYRYVITVPPLPPKKPIKPKVPLMLAAGFVASLIIGAFFAFLADLWSRRVIEPWQIETMGQVRVLGVIDAPQKPRELR